jgi:hypothetical protein
MAMRSRSNVILLAIVLFIAGACFAQRSQAEDYCAELDLACWPKWCFKSCPDNYCVKPSPCVPCLCWKGCCGPYCPKPIPCMPCVGGGSCYCYGAKPLPPIQCMCDPSYKCGPACAPAVDGIKQP